VVGVAKDLDHAALDSAVMINHDDLNI
jgi:hypothetical protein